MWLEIVVVAGSLWLFLVIYIEALSQETIKETGTLATIREIDQSLNACFFRRFEQVTSCFLPQTSLLQAHG